MKVRRIQNTMNSGEISPLLRGRTDLPQYAAGLKECRNMLILPAGGATVRPGSYWGGQTRDQAHAARLVRFGISNEADYVVELTDLKARFWRNRGLVMGGTGPIELTTPWGYADLSTLTFAHSLDVLLVFHGDYKPRRIKRTGASTFAIEEVDFIDGPYDTQNTGDVGASISTGTSADGSGDGSPTVSGSGTTGETATGLTPGGGGAEAPGGAG